LAPCHDPRWTELVLAPQPQDPLLRAELQRITETAGFNQVADVAALSKTHPHSIAFVTDASEQPHGYNCFMFALGLAVLPDHLAALAARHDAAFPGADFVAGLVERGLQPITADEAADGDLVLYSDERGRPAHAGIVQGRLVVSKWGEGHIWKHPVFEIPASYGVEVRVYRRITRDEALGLFEAFARQAADGDVCRVDHGESSRHRDG
jgi:hypothetical protein